jgi:hypothetical protein
MQLDGKLLYKAAVDGVDGTIVVRRKSRLCSSDSTDSIHEKKGAD